MKTKMTVAERVFSGCFPTGIVYADRARERHGDWVRLAYLNYGSLELELERDCPGELRAHIEQDAASIQARAGERYPIAGNMSVTLGSKHEKQPKLLEVIKTAGAKRVLFHIERRPDGSFDGIKLKDGMWTAPLKEDEALEHLRGMS